METLVKESSQKGPLAKLNETVVSGRIDSTGTFEVQGRRLYEARIKIRAADEFSMPGAVMVQSTYKLGNIGEDVSVHCEVTGFPSTWTDKDGVVKPTARILLRVIE